MAARRSPRTSHSRPTRRGFLRAGSALLALPTLLGLRPAPRGGVGGVRRPEPLRLGLIGCGGRGTGAAAQALSADAGLRLVALADAFSDRLDASLAELLRAQPGRVDVPAERRFTGFEAAERLLALDLDVVVLATPPGFRPAHFEAAIARGCHVFMEKPVAVDGPGVRRVLAAADEADRRGLKVGVGLQRHHDPRYLATVARIHDGALGRLSLLRVSWNSSGVWVRPREPGQTEMQYQMRNWYYFNWLCGDHIVEQHIHNLDVGNWVAGDVPAWAQGQGGRQVRTGPDHGEIYDHHMIEYGYADGTIMLSQCRHIEGCWNDVSEHAHGALGTADVGGGRIVRHDGTEWEWDGEAVDPFQAEHDALFAAIRDGTPHNEARRGAQATLTAILGRMASYSGQKVTWQQALNSTLDLSPARLAFDADPPSLPDASGRYAIPMPGRGAAY